MEQLQSNDIFDLFFLNSDEAPPKSHHNTKKVRYYLQGGNLFKMSQVCNKYFLAECNEDSEKLFGESKYKKGLVYPIGDTAFSKIERAVFDEAFTFLDRAYQDFKTEAVVLLLHKAKTKAWKMFVPVQYGMTGSSVEYLHPVDQDETKYNRIKTRYSDYDLDVLQSAAKKEYAKLYEDGYRISGSFHSHGSMPPFFSTTDDGDDMKCNGAHIVVGKLDTNNPEFCARISVRGSEHPQELSHIVEDMPRTNKYKVNTKLEVSESNYARLMVKEQVIKQESKWPVKAYNMRDSGPLIRVGLGTIHPLPKEEDNPIYQSNNIRKYLKEFVTEMPAILPMNKYRVMTDMESKQDYLVREDYSKEAGKIFNLFEFDNVGGHDFD